MSTALKLNVPAAGTEDHDCQRQARRARPADHPVHRRRRHRPGHLARLGARASTRPWRRPTAASARSTGWRSTPARSRTTCYNTWLPDETVDAFREYLVGIKGPLTTPIGGGIRSLNVALRQMLDLYVCLRPVRWFKGVPSPVKRAGEGRHGDLPREHRRHLRRHRVRGRHARTTRSSSSCSRRRSRSSTPRSASRTPRASASSPCRRKAPSGCSAPPSSTRSPTSARA